MLWRGRLQALIGYLRGREYERFLERWQRSDPWPADSEAQGGERSYPMVLEKAGS